MNKRLLTWNAHLGLAVIGIAITALGPAMPFVIEEYGLSLAQAGLVFTCLSLGRVIAVFFSGGWSDRVGRRPVMSLGAAAISLGSLGYAASPLWLGQLISVAVLGSGIGFLDGGCNALITDLYAERRGFALNRLHVFFGLGALAGPLVSALLLNLFSSWRSIFYVSALVSAASALFSLFLIFPDVMSSRTMNKDTVKAAKMRFLGAREFWLLCGTMFLYTGLGHSVVSWVNKYLSDELTATVLVGSTILAMYHVGITAGRIACSYVSERIGYAKTLLICGIGGFAFITMAVTSRDLWWIAVSFWLTGVFLAGLFPTAVALGTVLFPDLRGTLSGYLITAASLGGMVMPLVIGAFSDAVGLSRGMLGISFFAILLIVAAAGLQKPSGSSSQTTA